MTMWMAEGVVDFQRTEKREPIKNPNPQLAWFAPRAACCGFCGYPVVVTQGQSEGDDYAWYCANPACQKHTPVENTGDMEWPVWVIPTKEAGA